MQRLVKYRLLAGNVVKQNRRVDDGTYLIRHNDEDEDENGAY